MNPFSWFQQSPGTGALLDTRPESQKQKDHSLVEIVASANPVFWETKPEAKWRKFPDQNQDGSGSCVAQTIKKLLGILYFLKHGTFVRFSATHVYQRRSNKPAGGMIGVEAFDIAAQGVTLEELVSSELMTDAQMDAKKVEKYHEEVGKVFTISGHIGIPISDIDLVASTVQTTGKGVAILVYFTSAEWSKKVPTIDVALTGPADPRSLRHAVAVVDFTLYNGKKALIIEDSAHFGGLTRRVITEDFFKRRNFFVRYPMNFKFGGPEQNPNIPSYTFSKNLTFIPLDAMGNISDPIKNESQKADVIGLQNILKYEGFFPINVDSTGYYGSITAKHILAFQKKYKVDTDANLDALMGRSVGPKTIAVLNQMYSK